MVRVVVKDFVLLFVEVAGCLVINSTQSPPPPDRMSVHIPASAIGTSYEDDDDHSDGSGQSEEDNKELETFDDWVEEERPCKSLFEDMTLGSTTACITYDKESHGFDFVEVSSKLGKLSCVQL